MDLQYLDMHVGYGQCHEYFWNKFGIYFLSIKYNIFIWSLKISITYGYNTKRIIFFMFKISFYYRYIIEDNFI